VVRTRWRPRPQPLLQGLHIVPGTRCGRHLGQRNKPLLAKTESGKIKWQDTVEPNTFQVSFPNYSIILGHRILMQHAARPGIPTYEVSILNAEEKNVDSFTDQNLGGGYQQRIAELFQKVRRQALGADKALDEILNALKDAR
jgi:hypothetical protein